MQVRVRLVPDMPHGAKIYVRDDTDAYIIYMDSTVISAEGARFLECTLNVSITHWHRTPTRITRPHLRLLTG